MEISLENRAEKTGWITGKNSWANIISQEHYPEALKMSTEDLQRETLAYETEVSNLNFIYKFLYAIIGDSIGQGKYFAMKRVLEKRNQTPK